MYHELLIGGIISITTFSLFVSVPLYLIILIVIATHRHVEPFNSEFFAIFLALGIVDLVCYFLFFTKKLFFFGFIPSFFEPFNKSNDFASLYYWPFWSFAFLQYQLTLALTINRFVSIVWPGFYNANWTAKLTRAIIFGCILFSIILSFPAALVDCQISEYTANLDGVNHTFHYGPLMADQKAAGYFKFIWSIHVYGLIISSVFFYTIMVIVLKKKNLVGNKKKVEMQMFHIGLTIFILNVIFTIYFFLRDYVLVKYTANSHIHEWILYFISDIYDLPNGYMLWITSARIRKIIKTKMSKILQLGKVDVIMVVSANKNTKESGLQQRPATGTALQRQSPVMYVENFD